MIQSPTPAERQVLASQRTRTCCLRRNGTSRPLHRHEFRGSIPHPMRSLCTLHTSRRRLTRDTHYRAGATPYPGGTFTRWNTPAFPGAPVSSSRPAFRETWPQPAVNDGRRPPRACAARSVIEGRPRPRHARSGGGPSPRAVRWFALYGATVFSEPPLFARRGELADDAAGGSGLRNDGPSMRMVMQ